MMPAFKHLSLLVILSLLLSACGAPLLPQQPVAVAFNPTATLSENIYQVPADATATATPFQPIPPTAVFYPTETPTPTPIPTATPVPQVESRVGVEVPADQINYLLLGSDARPGSRNFRTDTIILASINPTLGTVSLVSFPRDLYVNIPGWGQDRINTAWAHGGFKKLAETINANFGVRPTNYVLINFSNFKRLIDGLGGLEIEVGAPVSDYYRGRYITIKPGVKQMDADLVLWYVRTRKTTNDFARNRRQQEVLRALVKKFLSLDAIARAPELYAIYSSSVTTDLGLGDMLPLIPLAAQLTDTSRIHHYYIGPKQVYDWITPGGAMVLLPRQDAIMKVMRQALKGQ